MVKKLATLSDEPATEPDQLLTIGQVTHILNVSRSLIYWLIRRGDLPTIRIGHALRFRPQDVADYIRKRAALPPKPHKPKGRP